LLLNLRLGMKDMLPGQSYYMTDLEQFFNEHHLHAVFKIRHYVKVTIHMYNSNHITKKSDWHEECPFSTK
jgi:hypothetical protein